MHNKNTERANEARKTANNERQMECINTRTKKVQPIRFVSLDSPATSLQEDKTFILLRSKDFECPLMHNAPYTHTDNAGETTRMFTSRLEPPA